MITIFEYLQITIIENSLIVFDIDDTIMHFEGIDSKWWDNKYQEYLEKYDNDVKKAKSLAIKDWIHHVTVNNPKLINEDNFREFINIAYKKNCKIIFLTARDHTLRDITESHFEICNLNDFIKDIYFSENKGIALKEIINNQYNDIKNIIFIDDLERNLLSVEKAISESHDLQLYLFCRN